LSWKEDGSVPMDWSLRLLRKLHSLRSLRSLRTFLRALRWMETPLYDQRLRHLQLLMYTVSHQKTSHFVISHESRLIFREDIGDV